MREGQPRRREKPRPEGVGPDWLTKQQVMAYADIRSDRAFRLLVEGLKLQSPAGIIEEGPLKPTWVSPDFAAKLKEQNNIPAAEHFMHAAKEAATKIPCNYDTFMRLVFENPPNPDAPEEKVEMRRAGNGAKVQHYSDAYIDALANIYRAEQEAREEASAAHPTSTRYTASRKVVRQDVPVRSQDSSVEVKSFARRIEIPPEQREYLRRQIANVLPQLLAVMINAPSKDKPAMQKVRSQLLNFDKALLQEENTVNPADIQEQIDEAQYYIDEA